MPKNKNSDDNIETIHALAVELGISDRSLRRYSVRADWNWGKPPYTPGQVEAMKRWQADVLQENRAETSSPKTGGVENEYGEKHYYEIRVKAEQAAKLKLDREIKEGLYVRRSEHDRIVTGLIYAIRSRIEDHCESFPAVAANTKKDESRLRALLDDWYHRFCEYMMTDGGDAMKVDKDTYRELKNISKSRGANKMHGQQSRR